ncbi:MAG TPA: hypothetical protein VMT31_08615 [Methanomicrobiales archaeon]|jgi:hypothetical protein|nr:hypothetical protein [Methanomicrobiales archaeon]
MVEKGKIRFGWLKVMYLWTIIGAGGTGLGMLAAPETMKAFMGWPGQDPLLFGVTGSIFVAFGIVSILGFLSPLKFVPVLVVQLTYKVIWYLFVLLPAFAGGRVPMYGWILAVIFATYVIGDLIAIPFPYVFEREAK